jgi:hypothetical protein
LHTGSHCWLQGALEPMGWEDFYLFLCLPVVSPGATSILVLGSPPNASKSWASKQSTEFCTGWGRTEGPSEFVCWS